MQINLLMCIVCLLGKLKTHISEIFHVPFSIFVNQQSFPIDKTCSLCFNSTCFPVKQETNWSCCVLIRSYEVWSLYRSIEMQTAGCHKHPDCRHFDLRIMPVDIRKDVFTQPFIHYLSVRTAYCSFWLLYDAMSCWWCYLSLDVLQSFKLTFLRWILTHNQIGN